MNDSFSELMAAGAVGIALFTMGPQLFDAQQGPLVGLEQSDARLDLEFPGQ